MRLSIQAKGRDWTLTDEHEASSDGVPVLVADDGTVYGPWDNAVDVAGTSGSIAARSQMTARAIAEYARDDHPRDESVRALVDRYLAIPA